MRNSYFAQAFRLATEDGSSDATVLPVVLEIDVKATDGSDEATPAQDPALEESATGDAPAAEPAAENDDGTAPVDAPAAEPAVPAAPIEGEGSESIEEFENNLITTDDLEAVETNNEIEEQLQEEATVSEAVSEVEGVVEAQEELLNEHPENINKEGVAIATECLYRAVKTAGLDPKMFQSLNQITAEYLGSEDFKSPVQALKIVHEDSKSFVQSAKDGLKRLWEMIVNGLKKLWEFIKRIFGNHAAIAKKLRENLDKSNYNPTGKKIDEAKYIPALVYLANKEPTVKIDKDSVYESMSKMCSEIVKASNKLVEKINSKDLNDLNIKEEINNSFNNVFIDKLGAIFPKVKEGSLISVGSTKLYVVDGDKSLVRNIKITSDMAGSSEIELPSANELKKWLAHISGGIVQMQVKTLKDVLNNVYKLKPEQLIVGKVSQWAFKFLGTKLVKEYEVGLIELNKGYLTFIKAAIAMGTGSADKKEEETKK